MYKQFFCPFFPKQRVNTRAYAEYLFAPDSLFIKVQQKVQIQRQNWLISCNGGKEEKRVFKTRSTLI